MNKKIGVMIGLFIFIIVGLSTSGFAVSECLNFYLHGSYTLENDVNANGTCFQFYTPNSQLDCAGFAINYSQSEDGNAFYIHQNYYNITIKNCNIYYGGGGSSQSNHAIYINGADNITLDNNTIVTDADSTHGIYVYNSSNYDLIRNNIINATGTRSSGIYYDDSRYSNVSLNNITTTYGYAIDFIDYGDAQDFNHTIYDDNLANGYKIAYLTQGSYDGTYDGTSLDTPYLGELIIVNDDSGDIKNLMLNNSGIIMAYNYFTNLDNITMNLNDRDYGIKSINDNSITLENSVLRFNSATNVITGMLFYNPSVSDSIATVLNNSWLLNASNGGILIDLENSDYNDFIENYLTVRGDGVEGIRIGAGSNGNTLLNSGILLIKTGSIYPSYAINDQYLSTINHLQFSNSDGEINWVNKNNLTLYSSFTLGYRTYIENGLIGQTINENVTNLNTSANIKFYDLPAYSNQPALLKDGIRCDEDSSLCNITGWNSGTGTLNVDVSGFSNYTVQPVYCGGAWDGLEDAELNYSITCENEVINATGRIEILQNMITNNFSSLNYDFYFNLTGYNNPMSQADLNLVSTGKGFTSDLDTSSNRFYIAMNESLNTIRTLVVANDNVVYAIDVDNNESTGLPAYGDLTGTEVLVGKYNGIIGVACYNISSPAYATYLTNGQSCDSSFLPTIVTNTTVYFVNNSNTIESILETNGTWEGITVKRFTDLDFYDVQTLSFLNNSQLSDITFGIGNLTFRNVTLNTEGSIFGGRLSIYDSDINFKLKSNLSAVLQGGENFYVNNSRIHSNDTGLYYGFNIDGENFYVARSNISNNGHNNSMNDEYYNSIYGGGQFLYNTFSNCGVDILDGACLNLQSSDINLMYNNFTNTQSNSIWGFNTEYSNITISNNIINGSLNYPKGGTNIISNKIRVIYVNENSEGVLALNNNITQGGLVGGLIGLRDMGDTLSQRLTLKFNNSYGEISWNNLLNASVLTEFSLGNNVFIESNGGLGNIGIADNDNFTNLNTSATIKFVGLNQIVQPYLMSNGVRCDNDSSLCNITSWNPSTGTLIANVTHFSNYTTEAPAFGLVFISPLPQTYTTKTIAISLLGIGGINNILWTDENSINHTFTVPVTHTFTKNGTITLYAYGDDGLGHNVNTSVTLNINYDMSGGGSTGGGGGGGGLAPIYFKVLGQDTNTLPIDGNYEKVFDVYTGLTKVNASIITVTLRDDINKTLGTFKVNSNESYDFNVKFKIPDYAFEDGQSYSAVLTADGYSGEYVDNFKIGQVTLLSQIVGLTGDKLKAGGIWILIVGGLAVFVLLLLVIWLIQKIAKR